MSIETMTKLGSITVGAGNSATSFSFLNIPQEYTDLVVKLSGRTAAGGTADAIGLFFNTLQANRVRITLVGNGTTASSDTSTYRDVGAFSGSTSTSNTFNNSSIYIANYSSNLFKSFSAETIRENNSSDAAIALISGLWSDTRPITSMTIDSSSAGAAFAQHSTFTLYGVKNAQRTTGNSIKATGGNISFDGTYVYHQFTSSGTFTPTTSLTADYLVVAGGGAGGGDPTNRYSGGGGGAGGLRSTFGSSSGGGGSLESKVLLLNGSSYPITIGAGGAGTSNQGNSGSNTTFLSITSTGGGGGGTANEAASIGTRNGLAGGSGGGAGGGVGTVPSGGAGTANQGYAGANSLSSGSGGGGGAGAAAVSSGTVPFGGIGVALPIDGATRYFAGGGGGANGPSAAAGGLGGGGSGGNIGVNGASGTGGGGGGSEQDYVSGGAFGGNGGSGVVIIRYKG